MEKWRAFLLSLVTVVFVGSVDLGAAPLTVQIFQGFVTTGGGKPYSGFVGSFTSADIQFGVDTGNSWHPFGRSDFGAQINGSVFVTTTGLYSFTLKSDDGSQLFIDNNLIVDSGGLHPFFPVTNSANLTAGLHSLEVDFFECCAGASALDLTLPEGVSFNDVPEPSPFALLGIGSVGMVWVWKRKKRTST